MAAGLTDDLTAMLARGFDALVSEGDLLISRRLFEAAYQTALTTGDHQAIGLAAIGGSGLWGNEVRDAQGSAKVRARLRRALSMVDPQSTLGLRLRARLAGEDDYRTGDSAKVLAVLDEARHRPDSEALADILNVAHHCLLGPDHRVLRRELAAELLEQSSHTMRRGDLLMGMLWKTVDLFLDGDLRAERNLLEVRHLLEQRGHLAIGFVLDAMDCMLAIRSGDLDHAENLAQVCAQRGRDAGDADATGWFAAQMVAIRWYQGRIAELLPMLQEVVHSPTLSVTDHSLFAAVAVSAAAAGDVSSAESALAKLTGRDLADLPRSSSWLVMMNGVVEAAHLLKDSRTSARAYELLSPFADLPMVASLGVACFGSVHHALGVAALTMGDVDKAIAHFATAAEQNLALAHWPAVAASRQRHALAKATADVEGSQISDLTCIRYGQAWKIESGDRSILLAHSVGMLHLAVLIANPGREIYSADLVAGLSELSRADAGTALSSQPFLDRVAVQNYRTRLADLRIEIEQLESKNEFDEVARVKAEQAWIMSELSAVTGIGGAVRRFPDGHERARIAVGKAIRRALARVTESDAEIGAYLRRTIHTGVRCSYRPT
ncbi:hypothetical protein GCM10029976_094240 [Kribbella albertanoniae]|nr:hypothetical protein [Kribbella albertanoniae]